MTRALSVQLRRIAVLAVMLAFLPHLAQPVLARIPATDLTLAMVPEAHEQVTSQLSGAVPEYDVSATFAAAGVQPARITGATRLHFVNFTNEPMTEIPLRLYPNAPVYDTDGMVLTAVAVDGVSVDPTMGQDNSLALVPLTNQLPPGQSADLEIDFVSTIPTDPNDDYAMFAYNSQSDSYNLGYWQPLLAGWTPDTGWNTGEILTRGDPVFTNIAFFSIELTAPTSIVFATTGIASEVSVEGESTTYHWSSGAVRDFVMIANQAFTTLEAQVGETLVRSFTTPDSASVAQDALDIAVAALRFFNERVGVFPYREFDMAQSDLGPRAAGIEFPALIYISENLYTPENFSLVFTIVHEVAHQYWYNLIGNNQYQHAFLDESLANYTAVLYLEAAYGEEVAEMAIDRYLTRTYLATLFGNDGDAIVDQPTADFISDLAYGRIVYGKGAIGMHQIRQAIGLEAFFAGLALYLDEHAYGVVNPVDLRTAFQEASGQNLEALWVHWFDETNGLQDFTPDSIIEIR